jgi:hypothetical protein
VGLQKILYNTLIEAYILSVNSDRQQNAKSAPIIGEWVKTTEGRGVN